jgi:hypothetical protein
MGGALVSMLALAGLACPKVTVVNNNINTITVGTTTAIGTTTAPTATPTVAPSPPGPYWTPVRYAGLGVGGVGVAGVAIGTVFGVGSILKNKGSDCTGDNVCRTQGDAAVRLQGQTWGTASTWSLVLGSVALATGVVIVVVAPRGAAPKSGATLTVGPGGVAITGGL